jgi:guanosine-3',5'-bis(diphosphate) 3'-pyrophosphohydrolase
MLQNYSYSQKELDLINKKKNNLLSRFHSKESVNKITKALEFSVKMHAGQFRKSGSPYVVHCIDVANTLVDWKMDNVSIISALLHDVVEDTKVTLEDINKEFGSEVALLVDGVTKIDHIQFKSSEHKQVENFTKLFLSLAKDFRVIIIKFSDRLNNMETIQFMSPQKRKEIAKETIEIFAPLAHRLGMAKVKWKLEDLSLKCIDYTSYNSISKKIEKNLKKTDKILSQTIDPIRKELKKYQIESEIFGRYKSISSIHRKMVERGKKFDEIYDLYAVRIIVDKIENCYLALGVIHSIYPPIQERFKDFIATPKTNGYQSIHTTVVSYENKLTEIQIRTKEMDESAEVGVAAHWLYKKSGSIDSLDSQVPWIRDLITMLTTDDSNEPEDMMDLLKIDMFEDEIYVFTPNGDLIKLPINATPLDFAFAIHSELGFSTIRAKVNDKLVPLSYKLKSGDFVHIERSKSQKPSSGWLNFVKTSKAKHAIGKFLRKQEIEQQIKVGEALLEKGLRKLKLLDQLPKIKEELEDKGFDSFDDLLKQIGNGSIVLNDLIDKFFEGHRNYDSKEEKLDSFIENSRLDAKGINLDGIENISIHYGRCCNPLPGDSVVGFISRGRGLIVHIESCENLSTLDDGEQRIVSVEWNSKRGNYFKSKLHLICIDKSGILNEITNKISKLKINILDVKTDVVEGGMASLWIVLSVKNLKDLNNLIKTLNKVTGVDSVQRVHN